MVKLSSETSHDSARYGWGSQLLSRCVSEAKIFELGCAMPIPELTPWLTFAPTWVVAITNVPPCLGCGAAGPEVASSSAAGASSLAAGASSLAAGAAAIAAAIASARAAAVAVAATACCREQ